MKKVLWSLGVVVLIVFILFGVQVYNNRGEPTGEEERVWRGWRGWVARQPYSIMKKILEDDDIHLKVRYKLGGGLDLQAYDALILSAHSDLHDEEDKAYLKSWVKDGGHLLISAQNDLAEEFGVEWVSFASSEKNSNKNAADEESDTDAESTDDEHAESDNEVADSQVGTCPVAKPLLQADGSSCEPEEEGVLRWENSDGVVFHPQAKLLGSLRVSAGKKRKARLGTFCDDKVFVSVYRYRAGVVTVFAHDIDIWANEESYLKFLSGMPTDEELVPVARGDNAAYLHDLLSDDSEVLLVRGDVWGSNETDWRLPAAKWWAFLCAFALAVLAILWFYGRRFGSLLEVDNKYVSDMSQHLQAAGQYWEDKNSYGWLAQNARKRLQVDLQTQKQRVGDDEKLVKEIAARCRQPLQVISHVLNGDLPQTEADFVQFMAVVEEIRMVL